MVRPRASISRLKTRSNLIIIAAVIVLVLLAVALIIAPFTQSQATLQMGNGVFSAQLALNDTDREKGLGGVTNLVSSQAMILAFPSDSKWQIWMKDMKIPIDIVWLNSDKKVIYIVKDAPVSGGTNVIYTPESNARYVLEFAAGTVEDEGIQVGQTASFDINTKDIK